MPFTSGQSGNPAGRPKGARDRRLRERDARIAEICARLGINADGRPIDAHGLLVAVYAEPALPIELRVDAAKHAIRFERPALSASNVSGEINHHVSIANQLACAVESRRVLTIEAEPAVMEAAE